MIQLTSISKEFGDRLLFYDMTFALNKGDKVGLVGRNGTGKSTLMKLIKGELTPDSGDINIPKGYKISSLDQFISFTQDTVVQECALALSEEEKYDLYKAEKILSGLGFSEEDLHKSPHSFSGGYQVRIQLAKSLLGNPDLLLLDEPTNYLDIVSLRWFQRFLKNFSGEFIIITHDRDFMNSVTTHTMGIHQQKLKKIKGDYYKYKEQIEEEKRVLDNMRVNQEKKKKQIETFINKFRAKARQASLANSRKKMLEKMEEFEKLEDESDLNFKFNYKDFLAKTYFSIKELSFGYQENKVIIDDFNFSLNKGEKVAIIGKNGKGKSTLLNLVYQSISPQKGEILFHNDVQMGYFGQTNIDRLHAKNTVEQEIASANPLLPYTRIRNVCGTMMFSGEDAKKPIKVLSGGEKSRVLLGKILIQPCNVLLLDEPTNHLDQESVESLTQEIINFEGGALFVTHSESLIRKVATKLIIFKNDSINVFDGNYDEFLQKIGWEDGETIEPQRKKLNKKELQKIKADLKRDFSKKVSPLKKEVEELEEKMSKADQEIKEIQQKIIQESEIGNGEEISKLSIKLNQNESFVEKSFEKLEELYSEIEKFKTKLEKELSHYQ